MPAPTCIVMLLLTIASAPAETMDPGTPPANPVIAEPAAPPTEGELERARLSLPEGMGVKSSRSDLWSELIDQAVDSTRLREQLARSRAEIAMLQKELDELRQFILDHEEFGTDYENYRGVREIAEQESRRRMVEQRRKQLDEQRAQQKKDRTAQQQKRNEQKQDQRFAEAGFQPIGLDVFIGRSSFFYAPRDASQPTVIYTPGRFGTRYVNPGNSDEIDYTSMTISGSILNGANDIRNIGVAITFFDEYENQIGAEIVQIENARPDIPYPFTAKIEMALNRPFATHASYVLYADPLP